MNTVVNSIDTTDRLGRNHGPVVRGPAGRAGFSIVELVVAMLILTVGLLGLAAATGHVIRNTESGQVDTERAQARLSAVELLRARVGENFTQNVDTTDPIEIGSYEVTWIETLSGDNSRVFEITLTGPGRGARGAEGGVTDTFEYRVNRTGGS